MQVEKYNEKAKASKAKAAMCPRNGQMQEAPIEEPPKKAVPLNIASCARQ